MQRGNKKRRKYNLMNLANGFMPSPTDKDGQHHVYVLGVCGPFNTYYAWRDTAP